MMLRYCDVDGLRNEISQAVVAALVGFVEKKCDCAVMPYSALPREVGDYLRRIESDYGVSVEINGHRAIVYNEQQADTEIALTLIHETVHMLNRDYCHKDSVVRDYAEQYAEMIAHNIYENTALRNIISNMEVVT